MKESLYAQFNGVLKENDDVYRGIAKQLGLSDTAFWILYALRETTEPLTQRQIADMFFVPKQTINSALMKLAADGVLCLTPVRAGRSKLVALTEAGVALCRATVDPVMAAEQVALDTLTEAEQALLLEYFRKYTDAMRANVWERLPRASAGESERE